LDGVGGAYGNEFVSWDNLWRHWLRIWYRACNMACWLTRPVESHSRARENFPPPSLSTGLRLTATNLPHEYLFKGMQHNMLMSLKHFCNIVEASSQHFRAAVW